MLVNSKEILAEASREGFALGAFNTSDLEVSLAIIETAEANWSSVIVSVSEKAIEYGGLAEISKIVETIANRVRVPVVLHLDHSTEVGLCLEAIKAGFTSVMYDGSSLSLKENIAGTRKVVNFAKKSSVSVEAEIGRIGGREDFVSGKVRLATVEEARMFVEETEVDSLAPALGTAHGLPVKNEAIDFRLLYQIGQVVKVPLVLHGASNISDDDIKLAIKLGIAKVNIDTELRQAFTKAVRERLADSTIYDPRVYLGEAKEAVAAVVAGKMKLFGSAGKAK